MGKKKSAVTVEQNWSFLMNSRWCCDIAATQEVSPVSLLPYQGASPGHSENL